MMRRVLACSSWTTRTLVVVLAVLLVVGDHSHSSASALHTCNPTGGGGTRRASSVVSSSSLSRAAARAAARASPSALYAIEPKASSSSSSSEDHASAPPAITTVVKTSSSSFPRSGKEQKQEPEPARNDGDLAQQQQQQQLLTSNSNNVQRLTEPTMATAVVSPKDELGISSSLNNNNAVAVTGGNMAWRSVVVVLCALWASNFAVAKLILAQPGVDSSLYAVARFSVAALALAPFSVATILRKGMTLEMAQAAASCGSWVALGYLGQTLGLLTTTASRSCVICSLHCVFVAIVAEWMRVMAARAAAGGGEEESSSSTALSFDTKRLAPAALAVLGVAIVELQGAGGAPTIGDFLSFAQPIGFGMGYLQLEELMSRRPDLALPVSAIKLAVVAIASLCMFELTPLWTTAAATEHAVGWEPQILDLGPILSSPVALGGILYTGLVTTALALWIESIAFARVPATDASIILTTEPLFAALFGAISLGETFGMSDYVGASLIVGACVLAALLDNPGDTECIVEEDPSCEPPRKWPFWGF